MAVKSPPTPDDVQATGEAEAAEPPGFAFYGAIGIFVCDWVPGPCASGPWDKYC